MIIVTGGAGFIGSNLVKSLNRAGRKDILVVDNLENGHKFSNLVNCEIQDYMDKQTFIEKIKDGKGFGHIDAVLHQGACSATTEWNGRYMMDNNYQYSKSLLHFCLEERIAFLYASSAAVYGGSDIFKEQLQYEKPINIYGYSKFLFDQYVRRLRGSANSQIAGFRYFNVYGPGEQHKASMASVAYHFNNQLLDNAQCKLFAGSDGYNDGEQQRDFVYIDDICKVNLWFLNNKDQSGIYNVGTGRSQTFNNVADAVIQWHGKGNKKYIDFPEHLKGAYQSCTQADISKLRDAGYSDTFATVETGVNSYLDQINQRSTNDKCQSV